MTDTFAPAPYLFVGFTSSSVENFMSLIAGLGTQQAKSNILKDFIEEDSIFFTNYANPNFISFSHGQAFSSESLWTMKLELIDPTEQMEKRIAQSMLFPERIGTSIEAKKEYAEYKNNYEKSDQYKKDLLEKLKKEGISQNTTSGNIETTSEKDFLTNKVVNFVNDNPRFFYITYGVGTDVETWAGPFKAILTGAEIDYSEFKKIILTFANIPKPADPVNRNLVSPNQPVTEDHTHTRNIVTLPPPIIPPNLNGASKQIEFNNLFGKTKIKQSGDNTEFMLDASQSAISQGSTSGIVLNSQNTQAIYNKYVAYTVNGPFDFHSMVVEIIRSLLEKIYNTPNILVLLPNLNELFFCDSILSEISTIQQTADRIKKERRYSKEHIQSLMYPNTDSSLEYKAIDFDTIFECFRLHGILQLLAEKTKTKLIYQDPEKENKTPSNGATAQAEPSFTNSTGPMSRLNKKYRTHRFYLSKKFEPPDGNEPDHKLDLVRTFTRELYDLIPSRFPTNIRLENVSYIPKLDILLQKALELRTFTDEEKQTTIFDDWNLSNEDVYIFGDENLINKLNSVSKLAILKKEAQTQNTNNYTFDDNDNIVINNIHPSYDPILKDKQFLDDYKNASFINRKYGSTDTVIQSSPTLEQKNETKRKKLFKSPFSKSTTEPELFAYAAKQNNLNLDDLNLPIFVYNLKNPNVLKIKVYANSIYFSELLYNYQKELSRKATRHLSGPYDEKSKLNPFLNEAALTLYIQEQLDKRGNTFQNQQDLIIELQKNLEVNKNLFTGVPEDQIPNKLSDLILKISTEGRPSIEYLLPPDASQPAFYYDIDRKIKITERFLGISIETLPFFSLSDTDVHKMNCFLFAKSPQILSTDVETFTERSLSTNEFDFISGPYIIIGFRHTIREGNLKSEFNLQRSIGQIMTRTEK